MAEVHLTQEGFNELQEKLNYLKNVRRTEIAEMISDARAQGDLSENAEYDAAKELQAKNEYEIAEIEATLKNALVIDENVTQYETVEVGATVKVKNIGTGAEAEYQIVGTAEADPFKNRISNDSPVGNSLLGHKAGEVVEVVTPGGVVRFKILSVNR